MRVWVTRTRPGADATAERLRALGHDPVVAPVLAVQPIEAAVDLAGADALAFTSRNGVDAFAALAKGGRNLPVFAVGSATAEAARARGFSDVQSADGDVATLAALIATAAPGAVLHPAARDPAGDLAGLLRERGVKARTVAVYDTVPVEPAEAVAQLASLDAVLVHSPKAARRLAGLVAPGKAAPLFACISEAAAAPLRSAGHEKVRSAPFPDEAALLKLLQDG